MMRESAGQPDLAEFREAMLMRRGGKRGRECKPWSVLSTDF